MFLLAVGGGNSNIFGIFTRKSLQLGGLSTLACSVFFIRLGDWQNPHLSPPEV